MILSRIELKVINEATPEDLMAAVNVWLRDQSKSVLIGEPIITALTGEYVAYIFYSE